MKNSHIYETKITVGVKRFLVLINCTSDSVSAEALWVRKERERD